MRILSGTKRREEREFYLRMAIKKRGNTRELARQIEAAAFERSVLSPPKLSSALREVPVGCRRIQGFVFTSDHARPLLRRMTEAAAAA
jgi:predicted nuclease of restriction endonuclease-like (RecB) superfamily